MDHLLSLQDIFRIAGKTCNVFTYPELDKINDIEELFDDGSNSAIILYVTKVPTNNVIQGHWTMLNKIVQEYLSKKASLTSFPEQVLGSIKRVTYQFLDSYAEFPDDELKHINKYIRKQTKQNKPKLRQLLYESGKDVYYNDKKLQILSPSIATCGRYIALYLKYNTLPVDDFVDIITKGCEKYNIPPDVLVTIMTHDPLDASQNKF